MDLLECGCEPFLGIAFDPLYESQKNIAPRQARHGNDE
jgi:hypothetical protein